LPAVRPLVVEGAGGLLAPLNDREFMADLALRLDATVILVSRNYLGSINHSLLTAEVCRMRGIRVAGWIFNDQYGDYEQEIARWSGLPVLGSVPFRERPDIEFIHGQAERLRAALLKAVG
jgi:dethiobiotin synthetase